MAKVKNNNEQEETMMDSNVIEGPIDIPEDFPQDFPERIQTDLFKKFDFSVDYSSVEKETKEEFQDMLLLLIAQISQHYKVTITQAAEWWIVWNKMSREQQMKYHLASLNNEVKRQNG